MTLGIINDKAEYETIEVLLNKQNISEINYDEYITKDGKDDSLFFIGLHNRSEFDFINKMICSDYGFDGVADNYYVRFIVDSTDHIELIFSGKFSADYRWYSDESVDCWLSDDEKLLVKGLCLRKLVEDF